MKNEVVINRLACGTLRPTANAPGLILTETLQFCQEGHRSI